MYSAAFSPASFKQLSANFKPVVAMIGKRALAVSVVIVSLTTIVAAFDLPPGLSDGLLKVRVSAADDGAG